MGPVLDSHRRLMQPHDILSPPTKVSLDHVLPSPYCKHCPSMSSRDNIFLAHTLSEPVSLMSLMRVVHLTRISLGTSEYNSNRIFTSLSHSALWSLTFGVFALQEGPRSIPPTKLQNRRGNQTPRTTHVTSPYILTLSHPSCLAALGELVN